VNVPHPCAPEFRAAYSHAWSHDPAGLLEFFAPHGTYTDVAMGTTYTGHESIERFHRFMLSFAPDSAIEFGDGHAADGHLYLDWVWSGTVTGPLRLRSGKLVDAAGSRFSVDGLAACEYGSDGKLTSHRDFWDLATVLDQTSVSIG
jgi:hypothetical protein